MRLGSSTFLGAAVTDGSITFAEVSAGGEKRTVRHVATFPLPAGQSFDSPEPLGQSIASFLRQRKFGASRVVIGVPAKWLIALEKELPPADETLATSMLRLQAERLAVAESGELAFDYAGQADPSQPSKVLLVAMPRKRLERVEQALESAGLTIAAVTSTALTLASEAQSSDPGVAPPPGLLLLGRNGVEMVWRQQGAPRMLRHLSFTMLNGTLPPLGPLSAELRRTVALVPRAADGKPPELILCDAVGLTDQQRREFSERLGVNVKACDAGTAMGLTTADVQANGDGFAPAAALAVAGIRGSALPIDFKHSRLAPQPPRRFGKRSVWGAATGAVLVVLIGFLYFDVHRTRAELDAANARLAEMAPDIKDAENSIERIRYARSFFETRPPMLDSLREITLSFGESERIWATSFTMRDNRRVQLSGKAANQGVVVAVRDRLMNNPKFADVKLLEVRDAGGQSRDVSFSISFLYRGTE